MGRELSLYHTSPGDIKEPSEGRFGKSVFFSSEPYFMTEESNPRTYNLNINEDDLINASSFFYRDDSDKLSKIVEEIMAKFKVDKETAEDLLSGKVDIHELSDIIPDFSYEDVADHSWDLQSLAGKAAEILGFKGVNLEDEQGTSSLINLHKVFDKLRKI